MSDRCSKRDHYRSRSVDKETEPRLGGVFTDYLRPFADPDAHFYLGGAAGIDTAALEWLAEHTLFDEPTVGGQARCEIWRMCTWFSSRTSRGMRSRSMVNAMTASTHPWVGALHGCLSQFPEGIGTPASVSHGSSSCVMPPPTPTVGGLGRRRRCPRMRAGDGRPGTEVPRRVGTGRRGGRPQGRAASRL